MYQQMLVFLSTWVVDQIGLSLDFSISVSQTHLVQFLLAQKGVSSVLPTLFLVDWTSLSDWVNSICSPNQAIMLVLKQDASLGLGVFTNLFKYVFWETSN